MYDDIRKAGRFKIFKRTEGISTTDIIGRMLRASHIKLTQAEKDKGSELLSEAISTKRLAADEMELDKENAIKFKMLNSTRRIIQFSNKRNPTADDKIVYTAGGFDVL